MSFSPAAPPAGVQVRVAAARPVPPPERRQDPDEVRHAGRPGADQARRHGGDHPHQEARLPGQDEVLPVRAEVPLPALRAGASRGADQGGLQGHTGQGGQGEVRAITKTFKLFF